MDLLVSLLVDALFMTLILGWASNLYLLVCWWRLPRRWSYRGSCRWLRLWRWGWALLLQAIILVIARRDGQPDAAWEIALSVGLTVASSGFWIAAAYARYASESEGAEHERPPI